MKTLYMHYDKCVRLHQQHDAKRKDMKILQSHSFFGGRQFNTLISKRKRVYIGGRDDRP